MMVDDLEGGFTLLSIPYDGKVHADLKSGSKYMKAEVLHWEVREKDT